MIVAKLEELINQTPANSRLGKALHYIRDARTANLADGRYEVEGEQVYALVQSYQTIPMDANAKYEAHRKYIDIQFILAGREVMGWAPLEKMTVTKAYSEEKDVCNGTCRMDEATAVKVDAGEAAIFFPSDAHAPKLAYGEPGGIKKIVMKVMVE